MPDHLLHTVRSLLELPQETEWAEFKHNNSNHEEIGQYISALANTAALRDQTSGYLLWGVDDASHQLLGTTFQPLRERHGNQDLQLWLSTSLAPRVDFRFHELTLEGKHLVLLEVPAARHTPVRFVEHEYIRVGSSKTRLRDYPEKERALWDKFRSSPFETDFAATNLTDDAVLGLLNYQRFFELTAQPLPSTRAGILDRLIAERFVVAEGASFAITNLGAILFASDLARFARLGRKALRIVVYRGQNKVEALRERLIKSGYAVGIEEAITFINDQLPQDEQLSHTYRKAVGLYPDLALRELVVNALIHQEFHLAGTGPMVEIYADRVEVTNPGTPLVDVLRLLDQPPRSRNEAVASFMRRVNLCEERGSGIDRIVFLVEQAQLPPPDFRQTGEHTVAVLYAPRALKDMDTEDRVRACYQHACLCYVSNQRMTNATLRQRLGIAATNYPAATKIINRAMDEGLVKPYNPEGTSNKFASYVPFWA